MDSDRISHDSFSRYLKRHVKYARHAWVNYSLSFIIMLRLKSEISCALATKNKPVPAASRAKYLLHTVEISSV